MERTGPFDWMVGAAAAILTSKTEPTTERSPSRRSDYLIAVPDFAADPSDSFRVMSRVPRSLRLLGCAGPSAATQRRGQHQMRGNSMSLVRVHNFSISLDDSALAKAKVSDHPSGMPAPDSTNGSSLPALSARCRASQEGAPGSTRPSRTTGTPASVPRSWCEASSGLSMAAGLTRIGEDGGVSTRPFMPRLSSSPTTRAPQSR
jgi:hypothetical protein